MVLSVLLLSTAPLELVIALKNVPPMLGSGIPLSLWCNVWCKNAAILPLSKLPITHGKLVNMTVMFPPLVLGALSLLVLATMRRMVAVTVIKLLREVVRALLTATRTFPFPLSPPSFNRPPNVPCNASGPDLVEKRVRLRSVAVTLETLTEGSTPVRLRCNFEGDNVATSSAISFVDVALLTIL